MSRRCGCPATANASASSPRSRCSTSCAAASSPCDVRLFVAVWPPAEAVDAVAALARPPVDGLRWTTPDQWHVTLRFIGSVDDPAPVIAALRGPVAALSPASVRMGPVLGRFGRRVLHVPVDGLVDVAGTVNEATAPFGQAPD